ncbi:hypothetical protein J6P04_01990 [bacterium]|nr:hypothetical protein [bacterium]
MDKDNKKVSTKTKFLNFITFGSLKRKALNQTNTPSQTSIPTINVDQFYDLVGGKNNVVEYKLLSDNSFKLILKDVKQVHLDELKSFCQAIGSMQSNNQLTLLTKQAKGIYTSLKDGSTN